MSRSRILQTALIFVVAFIGVVMATTSGSAVGQNDQNPPLFLPIISSPNITTYHAYATTSVPTLDPQKSESTISVDHVENLFVSLTNLEPETAEILPEAALSWTISPDALQYTFNLRTDIPWVQYDPISRKAVQVTTATGQPRFVTAADFVFAIKRACDPNVGGYYSTVVARQIAGCFDVLNYPDPANIPPALFDAIGVRAPSPDRLVIDMAFPSSYFLSMTPFWVLAATPSWTIAAHGDAWTEPQNLVTNGRFVLSQFNDDHWRLQRNQLMPANLQGAGNIFNVDYVLVPDTFSAYDLWLNDQLDIAPIPDSELAEHLAQHPDETEKVHSFGVFYLGFRTTKAPLDNVHLRRALSAAFDRQTYIDDLLQGQGLPMRHFAPPGIWGAPPIDEVGVGFDPAYAAAQLAAAGYPNCDGLPPLRIAGFTGQSTLDWLEFTRSSWVQHLGCNPALFQIEQLPFSELLTQIQASAPDSNAPHVWTLGWGPDYADEHNWVFDVLYCDIGGNYTKRSCSNIDVQLEQALSETNAATRRSLYYQIEEAFFGEQGEFPIAPLYVRAGFVARSARLDAQLGGLGGAAWYNWTILE